ncbi:MAG: SDR family oxidoreductase [Thermoguttaceae bacterium]|jgi:nucleoside-diphosphate-sugar epimerase
MTDGPAKVTDLSQNRAPEAEVGPDSELAEDRGRGSGRGSKLIVGCGYLGLRVARRWIAAGHAVAGLVRSSAAAESLARESIRPTVADVTQPSTLLSLPAADTLLYAVGYDPASGASRSAVYVDGLRAVLDAISPPVRRVILISSTGVYAEQGGGWVDESSPAQPSRESGRALLAAEEILAAHRLGALGIILRLAGIYGPGRLPRRSELAAGQPLPIATGQQVNLIHVDDAAAAVLAAEAYARPPRTYIISDGRPVERREYFAEMARQLGLPRPSFREPLPGEITGRGGGDKRVSNARMLGELHLKLAYPTYREGLAAAVR